MLPFRDVLMCLFFVSIGLLLDLGVPIHYGDASPPAILALVRGPAGPDDRGGHR
jgi:Kef-type K+ transport system membrane component KefB